MPRIRHYKDYSPVGENEMASEMSSLNEVFTRLKDANQPGGAFFK